MWLLWITQSEHHQVLLRASTGSRWQDIFNIAWNTRVSACFMCIQIAVQLREHAQILTRPVRLLVVIRANSLTLRQSARWQQLAQSSWRNQSWVLRISTENRYIRCNDSTRLPCATIAPDDLTIIILFISSLRIYARNLMMERTILVLHENVSRETSVKAIRVIINITI